MWVIELENIVLGLLGLMVMEQTILRVSFLVDIFSLLISCYIQAIK